MNLHEAIYKLNPTVVTIRGDVAYDANEQVIKYNRAAAETEAKTAVQTQAAAKQSALNKLMALGLTEEEALALGVK
jgi:hypothetical protein